MARRAVRRASRAPSKRGAASVDLRGRDFLTVTDLSAAELRAVLATASKIKRTNAERRPVLAGRSVVMLFEKPSLRTRVTFEIGVGRLGGQAVYLDHSVQRLGEREAVKDYGRNLERWTDGVVARVFRHTVIEELAASCAVPVINALSDRFHPCQALADVLTLQERLRRLDRACIAYVGDGNNVCHSLMHACVLLGASVRAITPRGHAPAADVVESARRLGEGTGATVTVSTDPGAVADCDAIYTDVWVSMGANAPSAAGTFDPYRVDGAMMRRARPGALFMHCLPAHRGEEVTDEVIDSPQSVVYDQAENRLHAQNSLLLHLMARRRS